MTTTQLTAVQAEAVHKIQALMQVTKATGMITRRSQNEILGNLSTEDLAAVARVLYTNEGMTNDKPRR